MIPYYLPRWMLPMVSPPSGTVLGRFWQAEFQDIEFLKEGIEDYHRELTYSAYGQPRLAWKATYSAFSGGTTNRIPTTVVYTLNSSSIVVRQAKDPWDFYYSRDPVWFSGAQGDIVIRNLERVTRIFTPDSSGNVFTEQLVPDSDVYIFNPYWIKLPASSTQVNPSGIVNISTNISVSGNYSSLAIASALDTSGTVSVNGDPQRLLVKYDLPNFWDISDVRRFLREDNVSYSNRLIGEHQALGYTYPFGIVSGVGRRIDRESTVVWDTLNTITFQASDHITGIAIPQLDRHIKVQTVVAPNSGYYLPIVPDTGTLYLILPSGPYRPLQNGNQFFVPASVSGAVTVEYRVTQWSITKDSSGNILSLIPGEIPRFNRLVYLFKEVVPNTLTTWPELKNPDDTPTLKAKRIVEEVEEGLKLSFGYTDWGHSKWFSNTDLKPGAQFLPMILDTI